MTDTRTLTLDDAHSRTLLSLDTGGVAVRADLLCEAQRSDSDTLYDLCEAGLIRLRVGATRTAVNHTKFRDDPQFNRLDSPAFRASITAAGIRYCRTPGVELMLALRAKTGRSELLNKVQNGSGAVDRATLDRMAEQGLIEFLAAGDGMPIHSLQAYAAWRTGENTPRVHLTSKGLRYLPWA